MLRWLLIGTLLLAAILVPFVLFEGAFERLGARMMSGDLAGWPAAALISGFLALDVVLPVPSSMVSTAAGAVMGLGRGAAVVWVGMMAGSVLGYVLGARATGVTGRFVGAGQPGPRQTRRGDLWRLGDRRLPAGAGAGRSERRARRAGAHARGRASSR